MKLPVPAPQIGELLQKLAPDVGGVLGSWVGPEVDGVYDHWDHVRHLPPPAGLTPETWWLALKLARATIARELPLVDKAQKPFRISVTDSMQRHLHRIDREAAGAIAGMEQSRDGQRKFLIRSLIEEAMTSSQLEGASTTRAVAKEMLATGREPRDHSEQMIYNNYQTMRELNTWRDQPFTPEAIISIHSLLTSETLESEEHSGRLRTAEDNVVIYDRASPPTVLHVPPPAAELPERLRRLCDFANATEGDGFLHPVVRAIAIHFQIGYDHPFCDGNGRAARMLFYWSMLRSGYWLTEYLSISSVLKKAPAQYIRAYLYTESDGSDLSYFVAHQLDVIEKSIDGLHAYIVRKSAENRRAQKLLRPASHLGEKLNHRQRALLVNAIHDPDRRYTIASHRAAHRITYPTALNDLNGLAGLELLERNKVGKAYVYSPVRDLAKRIE